ARRCAGTGKGRTGCRPVESSRALGGRNRCHVGKGRSNLEGARSRQVDDGGSSVEGKVFENGFRSARASPGRARRKRGRTGALAHGTRQRADQAFGTRRSPG